MWHGVAGFGASSVIHTAGLLDLSTDLPVVIEVVDDQAHVDRLVPILDEMIVGGALVTMERVRVLSTRQDPGGNPEAEDGIEEASTQNMVSQCLTSRGMRIAAALHGDDAALIAL